MSETDNQNFESYNKENSTESETSEIEELRKENMALKQELEKLREFRENKKKAMSQKAQKGELMSRAPFGYNIENSKLVPAQNFREVEEIFEQFLSEKVSLRKLAEKHSFSVNGLKKVLSNFTYIGKIKFNNQIFEGNHEPIISSTLFNHVQNKLEKLGIKRSV